MGSTLNLFTGGINAASLTTNLARGALLRLTTTEVFRVEALAGAKYQIIDWRSW
jgi:hypothetical protein